MTEWLDRIAADILLAERKLRAELRHRAAHRHPPYTALTITEHDARTLLRAALPARWATTKLRQPHARLIAAMSTMGAHLVTLNDPLAPTAPPAAAAAELIDTLRDWSAAVRWQAATKRARTNWPQPISGIMRQPPAEQAFPPPWPRLRREDPLTTRAWLQDLIQRRTHESTQGELPLAAPPHTAQIIDLRQLQLTLTPRSNHDDQTRAA